VGYNSCLMIRNDSLDQLANDPDFGRKVAEAVKSLGHARQGLVEIPSGCCANAAAVIASHHADQTAIIAVGENYGVVLAHAFHVGSYSEPEGQMKMLKALADKLGCTVTEKPDKTKDR